MLQFFEGIQSKTARQDVPLLSNDSHFDKINGLEFCPFWYIQKIIGTVPALKVYVAVGDSKVGTGAPSNYLSQNNYLYI
jgi:hypothetical protein